MPKLEPSELKTLKSFESGKLKSVATKDELEKMKAAARLTADAARARLAKLGLNKQDIAAAVAWARRSRKTKK